MARCNVSDPPLTRAITMVSNDYYLYKRDEYSNPTEYEGICHDLWKRVADELGLKYDLFEADSNVSVGEDNWRPMLKSLDEHRADVIVQRIDQHQIERYNLSK